VVPERSLPPLGAAPAVPDTEELNACFIAGCRREIFIAGLLVWMPLAVTVWVLLWVLGLMDRLFLVAAHDRVQCLPGWRAGIESLRHVPGLGVVVLLLLLWLTGLFVANIFGQWWLHQWNRLLHKIPIVRSVYSSVKQVSDTLFSSNGNAFREAVLVQYPRQGSWTIAFVTGQPSGEVARHLGTPHVSVYVPTTPNPTSGFFLRCRAPTCSHWP
jgi:uncharacterized membrane protein